MNREGIGNHSLFRKRSEGQGSAAPAFKSVPFGTTGFLPRDGAVRELLAWRLLTSTNPHPCHVQRDPATDGGGYPGRPHGAVARETQSRPGLYFFLCIDDDMLGRAVFHSRRRSFVPSVNPSRWYRR